MFILTISVEIHTFVKLICSRIVCRTAFDVFYLNNLTKKKSRNLLGAGAYMSNGHILLLFHSDKYTYKITISYPYNLHFHVHTLSLSLSLSLSLLNSHLSKLNSCNCSLINTPFSVMFFTHISINFAMSIKKQPINTFQLKWLLKLKNNKCTIWIWNRNFICVFIWMK
jgi:hypothetical protein